MQYIISLIYICQYDWDDSKLDVEEDEDLTSLSEMEEQEWEDESIDSFDDNDSFNIINKLLPKNCSFTPIINQKSVLISIFLTLITSKRRKK